MQNKVTTTTSIDKCFSHWQTIVKIQIRNIILCSCFINDDNTHNMLETCDHWVFLLFSLSYWLPINHIYHIGNWKSYVVFQWKMYRKQKNQMFELHIENEKTTHSGNFHPTVTSFDVLKIWFNVERKKLDVMNEGNM